MRDPKKLPALWRSVPIHDLEFRDGILDAVLVPFDQLADVVEREGDRIVKYREGFLRTAFDRQLSQFPQSLLDVTLIPRHGSSETFGRLRSATPEGDGLHGSVSVLPSRRDDVQTMIDDGIDQVSIEFHPLERHPRVDGRTDVRWRSHAMLTAVALTSIPTYQDARVLALRDDSEGITERAAVDDGLGNPGAEYLAALNRELDEMRAAGEKWKG